jgi:uncharacterized membrane protein YbaN (DUF454 family)
MNQKMRSLWFIGGTLSAAIGFVGVFLPLLPTVPLMLLAAFCFGKSSQTAHDWLVNHQTFGPPIADWRRNGAISTRAKQSATVAIALAFSIYVVLGVPLRVLIIQAVVLSLVLTFIWTRPSD